MKTMRTIHVLLVLLLVALAWPAAGAAQADARISIEPGYVQRFQPVDVRITVTQSGDPQMRYEGRDGHRLIFSGSSHLFPGEPPPARPYTLNTRLDPLPPGVYNVEVRFDGGTLVASRAFEVHEVSTILELQDAFEVTVDWDNPHGPGAGTGAAVPLSDESGYFWFFDPENVEVTVKILDGRPVNGHWWIFIANMTDLELDIRVTRCAPGQPAPCPQKTYRAAARTHQNFIDHGTFK